MKNLILSIFIHIILGLLISSNSLVGTIHAQIVVAVAIYFSLFDKNTDRTVPLILYITGAELLWRGFGANVFWEYGKYSAILLMAINISRFGSKKIKNKIGFLILLLLLPSFVVLNEFERQSIAHAMSGPFCLGIAVIFFSNQIINKEKLILLLTALALPIISLLSIMLISTLQYGEIDVYAAYVKAYTTAGVGPNQASNILGLGVLTFFLLYLVNKENAVIYMTLGLLMLFQTIITHSRGGFWNAFLAVSICITFLFAEKKVRQKFFLGVLSFCLLLYIFVFPIIDDYSKGSISNRYTDTDISHRENIIETELRAFVENPLLGIGPGSSRSFRIENYNSPKHTHTEYTRLLSEHGLFGFFVILLFLIILKSIIRKNNGLARSISLSLIFWSLLFMFHSATRLAAPAIIFGLSTIHFRFSSKNL